MTSEDKAHVLFNPSAHYATPRELAEDLNLSREEKIKALCQWSYDIREAEVAEEEGMPNPKPDLLPEVIDALETLGHKLDLEHVGISKQHPMTNRNES